MKATTRCSTTRITADELYCSECGARVKPSFAVCLGPHKDFDWKSYREKRFLGNGERRVEYVP